MTSTCGGWETAYITARAMSSSCSASVGRLSKNGVSTMPGSISVTRTPVPCRSWRAASPIAVTACLVHEYSEPGSARRPATLEVSSRCPRDVGQRGDRRAQRQRGAVDVREDHLAPVLGRVLEKAARAAEAGVGERRVDLPEGVERVRRPCAAGPPTRSRRSAPRARARGRRAPRRAPAGARASAPPAPRASRPRAAWRAVAAPMPEEAPVIRRTRSVVAGGSLLIVCSCSLLGGCCGTRI